MKSSDIKIGQKSLMHIKNSVFFDKFLLGLSKPHTSCVKKCGWGSPINDNSHNYHFISLHIRIFIARQPFKFQPKIYQLVYSVRAKFSADYKPRSLFALMGATH